MGNRKPGNQYAHIRSRPECKRFRWKHSVLDEHDMMSRVVTIPEGAFDHILKARGRFCGICVLVKRTRLCQ